MNVADVEATQFGYPTYKPLLDSFVAAVQEALDLKPDEVLVL